MPYSSAPLRFGHVVEGKLPRGSEVPIIDALIEAGADLNFQRNGRGDTPLIGAASLGAEDVGIRPYWMPGPDRNCVGCSVKPRFIGLRRSARTGSPRG